METLTAAEKCIYEGSRFIKVILRLHSGTAAKGAKSAYISVIRGRKGKAVSETLTAEKILTIERVQREEGEKAESSILRVRRHSHRTTSLER